MAAAGTGGNWWAFTAWCIFGWAALMAGDLVRAREANSEPMRTGHRGLGGEAAYLTSTKSPVACAVPVVVVPAKAKR